MSAWPLLGAIMTARARPPPLAPQTQANNNQGPRFFAFPPELRSMVYGHCKRHTKLELGFSWGNMHEKYFLVSWTAPVVQHRHISRQFTQEYDSPQPQEAHYHVRAIQVPNETSGQITLKAPMPGVSNVPAPSYWSLNGHPAVLELLMAIPAVTTPNCSSSGSSGAKPPNLIQTLDHILFTTSCFSDEVHARSTHVRLFLARPEELDTALWGLHWAMADNPGAHWRGGVVDVLWREGGGVPQDGEAEGAYLLARKGQGVLLFARDESVIGELKGRGGVGEG